MPRRSSSCTHAARRAREPTADVSTRCRTTKHGEDAPEMADVYFAYGKALLENAIAQSSVLGKEQTDDRQRGKTAEDVAALLSAGLEKRKLKEE